MLSLIVIKPQCSIFFVDIFMEPTTFISVSNKSKMIQKCSNPIVKFSNKPFIKRITTRVIVTIVSPVILS